MIPSDHSRRRRDTLGLTNAHLAPGVPNEGYRSAVVLGEGADAKTFFVMFDTGSAEFWVFSNLMDEDEQQVLNGTRVLYDPLN